MAVLGLILATFGIAQQAHAQLDKLTGRRVRLSLVRAPGGISTSPIGTLTEVTADSLMLAADVGRMSVARRSIWRLDVRVGTQRKTKTGAVAGMAMGAFGLAAVGAATTEPCNEDEVLFGLSPSPAQVAFVGVLAGGLLGAAIGAVFGSSVQVDRWHEVDLRVAEMAAAPGRPFVPTPSLRVVIRI